MAKIGRRMKKSTMTRRARSARFVGDRRVVLSLRSGSAGPIGRSCRTASRRQCGRLGGFDLEAGPDHLQALDDHRDARRRAPW